VGVALKHLLSDFTWCSEESHMVFLLSHCPTGDDLQDFIADTHPETANVAAQYKSRRIVLHWVDTSALTSTTPLSGSIRSNCPVKEQERGVSVEGGWESARKAIGAFVGGYPGTKGDTDDKGQGVGQVMWI